MNQTLDPSAFKMKALNAAPRVPRVTTKDTSPVNNTITLDDYVHNGKDNSNFGVNNYNVPSNEMLLKKTHLGKSDKCKNSSFL